MLARGQEFGACVVGDRFELCSPARTFVAPSNTVLITRQEVLRGLSIRAAQSAYTPASCGYQLHLYGSRTDVLYPIKGESGIAVAENLGLRERNS